MAHHRGLSQERIQQLRRLDLIGGITFTEVCEPTTANPRVMADNDSDHDDISPISNIDSDPDYELPTVLDTENETPSDSDHEPPHEFETEEDEAPSDSDYGPPRAFETENEAPYIAQGHSTSVTQDLTTDDSQDSGGNVSPAAVTCSRKTYHVLFIYILFLYLPKKSHILELTIFICSKHHTKDAEYNYLYIFFGKNNYSNYRIYNFFFTRFSIIHCQKHFLFLHLCKQ